MFVDRSNKIIFLNVCVECWFKFLEFFEYAILAPRQLKRKKIVAELTVNIFFLLTT